MIPGLAYFGRHRRVLLEDPPQIGAPVTKIESAQQYDLSQERQEQHQGQSDLSFFHVFSVLGSSGGRRNWGKRCSGVVTSLREGGEELLTFFRFPKEQWKTLRTTNTIERLHEEFRRRVKTQSSLPTEDSAVVLLFSLVASGQIRLRRVDGWQKIATVLSQNTSVAA